MTYDSQRRQPVIPTEMEGLIKIPLAHGYDIGGVIQEAIYITLCCCIRNYGLGYCYVKLGLSPVQSARADRGTVSAGRVIMTGYPVPDIKGHK